VRTGGRFGLGHLMDVLAGRLTDKVAQHGHDRLPTFGVGKGIPEGAWRGVARQLVTAGALDIRVENHGELVATEAARPFLRGERRLMLREAMLAPRAARGRAAAAPVEADDPCFAALREWRKAEARAQSVPAYVIFHDATLAEIAARRPASLDALAAVPGVGASKLERYGEAVLEVVRAG
nr:HRDC domain-containing protein [Rubritepida sp.]